MSGSHKDQSHDAGGKRPPAKSKVGDKKNPRHRTTEIGRALRTVYDDTLREDVPDDFLDMLGKLS